MMDCVGSVPPAGIEPATRGLGRSVPRPTEPRVGYRPPDHCLAATSWPPSDPRRPAAERRVRRQGAARRVTGTVSAQYTPGMPTPGEWVMTCPHCSASPTPVLPQPSVNTTGGGGNVRTWKPASCPACGGMIVAEIDGDNHIEAAYPKDTSEWDVHHLPADVRTSWEEAVKVYRVGACLRRRGLRPDTGSCRRRARRDGKDPWGQGYQNAEPRAHHDRVQGVPWPTSDSFGTSGPMRQGRCAGRVQRAPCVSRSRPSACGSRCPRNAGA